MIYISLLLLLLIFMAVSSRKNQSSYSDVNESYYYHSGINRTSRHRLLINATTLLLFFWFVYAVIIMGFRGDFTADYNGYDAWFHRIDDMPSDSFWEYFGIKNIFSMSLETGYAMLNWFLGWFTNNSIWLFVACAIIICAPAFLLFYKCEKPWLAVLLWISIGPYLESFNTMRGAMAASILIFSLKYLKERKLVKYIIVVLIATSFHSIAIVMLIVYFLPLIKPSIRSVIILVVAVFVVSTFGEVLVTKYNNIFHIAYNDVQAVALLNRNKSSGASLIVPLMIEVISFFLFFDEAKKGEIDLDDTKVRILFNGNLIWVLFTVLLLVTSYSTRFAMLFFYYPCIFISYLIARRKTNRIYYLIIVGIASVWYLVNALFRYPAYYFAF